MNGITKTKSGFMSNCNECGRKTQIIRSTIMKSGKQKGWKKVVHRCELHGNFTLLIRPPRKGE